ncbi:MAG: helix-turn-helix domain-containing protein [Nevskiales bacterium]|nr:helix-turn-helix domain-containing protein [Nevskiales bacterium]
MKSSSLLDHYGDTQRRMLELLLHVPGGATVDALVSELEITTNAVRQHLAVLERDGLVARTGAQRTRGRPEIIFSLTSRGREAFPRSYAQLAESLIEEIGSAIGPESLEGAMQRMGRRAGNRARLHGMPSSIEDTAAAMRDAGYEASTSPAEAAEAEIVAYNCVFHRLAERFPSVCQFDLAFLQAVTGRKVEHRECMVRGGQICRFGFGAKTPGK